MRILAILAVAMCFGCAHQETAATRTKTIVKKEIVYRDRAVERMTYACHAEPPKGCNSLSGKSECDANKRCQWVNASSPYCRRLPCND